MTVGTTENRREWESSSPERNAELVAAANRNIELQGLVNSGQITDLEAAVQMASYNLGATANATEGTSSRSRTLPTTYNKKAADALLEQALLDALNIVPDAKTKAEFFKGLNVFLKVYGSTSGTSSSGKDGVSSSTSSSVQGADATVYLNEFVKEVIKDTIKKNPNAPLGGKVGDTMRSLSSYAADMGVFKSPNEITNKAVDVITGKSRQEDILVSYRKDAQALYANFAPRLAEDSGLTVRDLANPYIQMMADTFETASDNIKLTDDTIQKAINDSKGLINLGQFRTMLRNDKRFETTSTAKREAADLGSAMLRSFGFGA
jgi:hypothetical protein